MFVNGGLHRRFDSVGIKRAGNRAAEGVRRGKGLQFVVDCRANVLAHFGNNGVCHRRAEAGGGYNGLNVDAFGKVDDLDGGGRVGDVVALLICCVPKGRTPRS